MKRLELTVPNEILVKDYLELNSCYKIAAKYNVSATAVKRILKELGVLRTQNEAAKNRLNNNFKYERTEKHLQNLSNLGKQKTGENNPFFGKTHSEETKQKMSESAKNRQGKINPNYKHGKNIRRPRDFKNAEMQKLRNFVFNRDNFSCYYCDQKGGHLHAHHKIPYWLKPDAFTDVDNLITVCTDCHFTKAHKSNWSLFDIELINENLFKKYSLNRERLNELTAIISGCDSLNSTDK